MHRVVRYDRESQFDNQKMPYTHGGYQLHHPIAHICDKQQHERGKTA